MFLRLTSLAVLLPGLLASLILAGAAIPPACLVTPDHFQLRLPDHGFKWAEGEQPGGECKAVPAKKWLRQRSGTFDLFVYANGPSGSGRYWTVTIGVSSRQRSKPVRGICFVTSTAGWRTLQQWSKSPLPWLDDLDRDGKAELIIWNSFPLREQATQAEYGLMAWVYRVDLENSFAIDWDLSRKMAGKIAKAYRSSLASTMLPYPGPLRAAAAEALERFVDERCSVNQPERRGDRQQQNRVDGLGGFAQKGLNIRTGSGPGSPRGQPAWGGGSDRPHTLVRIYAFRKTRGFSS